jgi:CMP-N-acetylneuraminic acid synthetase
LSVEEIDAVVINTDAREILKKNNLTASSRVIIRDRKPEICGDTVSMNLVIADDISNVPADIYLMTHTTNPLMSRQTIQDAIDAYKKAYLESGADSLFTVDKVQTRFYKKDATPINHDPKNLIPTQNLEPWYEENSNLYIFTADSFSRTKARIGSNPFLYESPMFESIDIDTPEDWDFAVVAAHYLQEKKVDFK